MTWSWAEGQPVAELKAAATELDALLADFADDGARAINCTESWVATTTRGRTWAARRFVLGWAKSRGCCDGMRVPAERSRA